MYNAARFYIALEAICFANNEPVYVIYQTGRHFEGRPYFECYMLNMEIPDIDLSVVKGDPPEEMKLGNKYLAEHPREQPSKGEFYTEPYDEYEKLCERLIDYTPDFKLRLKVNQQNNRLVISVDLNSVFDIAWYVLARMMLEDLAPEEIDKEGERP